eukprot:scaffold24882_cov38-Cyclotella_meneghiniana.AAC.2
MRQQTALFRPTYDSLDLRPPPPLRRQIKMSDKLNNAISLVTENKPLSFVFGLDEFSRARVWVRVSNRNGIIRHALHHELDDVDGWNQLGAAIGRSKITLRKLELNLDEDYNMNISNEGFRCIEALFRGLQSISSIQDFRINTEFLSNGGTLPLFDMQGARFKRSLKRLMLFSYDNAITDDQSDVIGSFLESTSLERCNVRYCIFDVTNEESFRRIMLACSKVKYLAVEFTSLSQSAAVAELLADPRSILSEISIFGNIDKERLSTIAAGLVDNTTLKCMYLHDYSEDWSPMIAALCNTSSIERIIASNHTFKEVSSEKNNAPILLQDYLTLNEETNKSLVIRTKIARYYFRGDFDISTFASMDVKCLPRMLTMIGGGETNSNAVTFRKEDAIHQVSAIFRLLKCIPDLCNISSRDWGHSGQVPMKAPSVKK